MQTAFSAIFLAVVERISGLSAAALARRYTFGDRCLPRWVQMLPDFGVAVIDVWAKFDGSARPDKRGLVDQEYRNRSRQHSPVGIAEPDTLVDRLDRLL